MELGSGRRFVPKKTERGHFEAKPGGDNRAGRGELDAVTSDWIDPVDTSLLYNQNTTDCVYGQVFGSYSVGKEKDGSLCGFTFPTRYASCGYVRASVWTELNARWVEFIERCPTTRRLVIGTEKLLVGAPT